MVKKKWFKNILMHVTLFAISAQANLPEHEEDEGKVLSSH